MILIYTITLDNSTSEVIDWLNLWDFSVKRINGDVGYKLKVDETIFIEGVSIDDFKSYWYRKGMFSGLTVPRLNNFLVQSFLEENRIKILQYVEAKLCKKKYLNRYFNSNLNKLLVLEQAKKAGLKVPDFVLTDNLKDVHKQFIYKSVNEGSYIEVEDYGFSAYTEMYYYYKEKIYGITFFQEFIEKKYELRIFYLDGRFFSMAIFSQKDAQTRVDFRHYNNDRPNRNIPFKLPDFIEGKLDLLMKKLDLKSGSIDMIVSKDMKYYFLEVNPVGQFGMVSYPCNYHLEKEIAEYLSYD
ncbi:MAG TPA: grasp-with-spasm system ATP-grasp peptide maturase [Moheibacter sp.]|nr:grasp-with-spasm system ATP-grasp peptide maturase [Moheibacter sp.]